MKVLLSIKPEFAHKIFLGIKKYEFRKFIFKHHVSKVIVYASSPVKMVIGEFDIEEIIFSDIDSLWKHTKKFSGIEKHKFSKYFRNKKKGYAIKIKSYKKYENPLYLKKEFGVLPPQSFVYLK